ncbi:MAG: hypothetical protein EBZ72_02820, partial [Burkholderiaceae bacterium]|nr:hypothetical protein [Burkholderiaceae bacterium]
ARALDFAGRYAEAEQAALSALEVAPQDPEVQRILGRSLLHQNKLAAAKSALEKAGQLGDHLSGSLASMLRPDRMSVGTPAPHLSRALAQILDERGNVIGSGCFLTEDGLVLTAAHVVAGRDQVSVRIPEIHRANGPQRSTPLHRPGINRHTNFLKMRNKVIEWHL